MAKVKREPVRRWRVAARKFGSPRLRGVHAAHALAAAYGDYDRPERMIQDTLDRIKARPNGSLKRVRTATLAAQDELRDMRSGLVRRWFAAEPLPDRCKYPHRFLAANEGVDAVFGKAEVAAWVMTCPEPPKPRTAPGP